MARSHFSGPIRVESGIQIASNKAATGRDILSGNILASNAFKIITTQLAASQVAANTTVASSHNVTSLLSTDRVLAVIPASAISSGLAIAWAFASADASLNIGWANASAAATTRAELGVVIVCV